jgi:Tol biopolymer transport system component
VIAAACALVAWASSAVLEARCDGTNTQVFRQRLSGPRGGLATAAVSADGRFVAFVSLAQLLPADDNVVDDIYVLDRVTGRLSLESIAADGRTSNGSSEHPRLSADGRILVYSTIAPVLLGTQDLAGPQVLRRDRTTGTTTLVSHTRAGGPVNNWTGHPDVSDDGRYVVFESRATDLVPGVDANGSGIDVYLYDASTETVRRLSVDAAGDQPPDGESMTPAVSGSGRFVAFTSSAPLDGRRPAAGSPQRGVFLRDLETGVLRRLSATRDRGVPNGASYHPSISADGRRVAFVSTATDLDDDARATAQENVFLYDSQAPRLRLVSRSPPGGAADGGSRFPTVSGDGRYVVFSSEASNLHCVERCDAVADVNLVSDIYRADTATGRIERISGAAAGGPWWNASAGAATDGSGRIVAFSSREPIHAADLDHDDDLYVEAVPARDEGSGGSREVPPCAPAAAGPHAQPLPLLIARGPPAASESSMRMLVRGVK